MITISPDIARLLEEEATRINSPQFISADPVQFPRRFNRLQDIEAVAFLSAIIAWGKRTMICRNAERMLQMMDYSPADFIMEEAYEAVPDDMNLHRTFFGRHLKYFLRGMRKIFELHGSLDAFSVSCRCGDAEAPAWEFADSFGRLLRDVNNGESCSQCVPTNLQTTALKRINMVFRWLVRDDGIVDMGVWKSIPKGKLFIPLDVHAGNTARSLGLLSRRANDRKSVEDLTAVLRYLRPDDPAFFDYALFGIGVSGGLV